MQLLPFLALALALAVSAVSAHTIAQRLTINGELQPLQYGMRVPGVSTPLYSGKYSWSYNPKPDDISTPAFACNRNHTREKVPEVVDVPAGATVGFYWWGYIIDRDEGTHAEEDSISPLAWNHLGPVTYFIAKVDDAVTADASSLDWFKIAEDGLDLPTKTWGSQNLIANEGWTNVTLPFCLASSNYLIRSEVYSLHDAGPLGGGTQHFLSCAQLNVVDGGSWTGSNFVKFPGAYKPEDPMLRLPKESCGYVGCDHGGEPYIVPGGPVQTCPSA